MNIGIEVNVMHVITEEDIDKLSMNLPLSFDAKYLEKYTFYNIDYTKPLDDKKCILSSAGLDFIINESYESLNNRIQQMQTFRFN